MAVAKVGSCSSDRTPAQELPYAAGTDIKRKKKKKKSNYIFGCSDDENIFLVYVWSSSTVPWLTVPQALCAESGKYVLRE